MVLGDEHEPVATSCRRRGSVAGTQPTSTAKALSSSSSPSPSLGSDYSDEDSDCDQETSTAKAERLRKQQGTERREARIAAPILMRLPIHQANVKEDEAGGITYQIGVTYSPLETIKQRRRLLIIDTPGYAAFTNVRSCGSSLCTVIFVVDIMHGLEFQTLESLKLLRDRKTSFIFAMNKEDCL
ncbi:MAG: P-loop containing nucleoside triphosphate hydrolase protein [Benniella sp.]|nr:MAG: P-loop containing nucleoside triphosphate hydrolase protein [Benniella sp.]